MHQCFDRRTEKTIFPSKVRMVSKEMFGCRCLFCCFASTHELKPYTHMYNYTHCASGATTTRAHTTHNTHNAHTHTHTHTHAHTHNTHAQTHAQARNSMPRLVFNVESARGGRPEALGEARQSSTLKTARFEAFRVETSLHGVERKHVVDERCPDAGIQGIRGPCCCHAARLLPLPRESL